MLLPRRLAHSQHPLPQHSSEFSDRLEGEKSKPFNRSEDDDEGEQGVFIWLNTDSELTDSTPAQSYEHRDDFEPTQKLDWVTG
jgi:hypothetical protein